MADKLVGTGFDETIGTRFLPGQSEAQFYNKQNNNPFDTPVQLAQFVNTQTGRADVNERNVFGVLSQGLGVAAPNPTQVLNQAQQSAFEQIKATPTSDPNLLRETASQAIGNGVVNLQSEIKSYQKNQQTFIDNVSEFYKQSDRERSLTTRLNDLDTSYEMGQNKIEDQPIAMEFITGQQASNERRYVQLRNTLVRQLQSETASRQQKLEAAKFLYDSNRNSLADTITLFNATKPENIGNVVDPETGEMTVIMQNPVTGEVARKKVGVVQTPKRWTENLALAREAGVNKPFFTVDDRTIINTNSGREYSTPEQFFADGGSFDPAFIKANVQTGVQSLARQQFALQQDQFAFNKQESNRNYNLAVERLNLDKKGNFTATEDTSGNRVLLNTTTGQTIPLNAPTGRKYSELYGAITGPDGSSLWKNGVDIDLKKGDPVYSPVSGEVVFSGTNGGFGNQVKIRDTNGNEVWLSHLDANSVKVGQQVTAGMLVGVGGNTGNVIKGKGGDGSHLDMTVKTPSGFMTARQALAYADQQYATTSNTGDLESRLKATAGDDGKVSPQTYLSERQKAKVSPDEFDKRYGHLLSPQEQKTLGIAGGQTAQSRFLNGNYLKSLFTPEALATKAKESGFVVKRRFAPDKPDVDGYVKSIESSIEQYRQAGFTDEEILKLMNK